MSSFLDKLKKGAKTGDAGNDSEKKPGGDLDNGTEDQTEDHEEGGDNEQIENGKDENIADQDNGTDETDSENENAPQKTADGEEKPKRTTARKTKKTEKKLSNLEIKTIPALEETEKQSQNGQNEWLNAEGQLTVDVFQTENELVIQSAIAGIKTENLDVLIEEDVLTIKGRRDNPYQVDVADYFIQECYWGPFSRKIILPVEVDSSKTDATMKDGILTIRIPKVQKEKKKRITIKG